MKYSIRFAHAEDVGLVKIVADAQRDELGFIARQSFEESAAKGELLIAVSHDIEKRVLGFVRFHRRRDSTATIYEIATAYEARGGGIGRALILQLRDHCLEKKLKRIRLLCPVELPANDFYAAMGFERTQSRSLSGRKRPLYEWQWPVVAARTFDFVASMTAATSDLDNIIRLWEREGEGKRPFDFCIVTPLFADPGALRWIRYMHDAWGVEVIFDSGGFYVQQEKIAYEDLFSRLLRFYETNDWGYSYVLPDYVPTSRQNAAQVQERVHVTAAEGVKFFARMPAELRSRVLGVLQGHTPEQLALCFEAFRGVGIERIGFGSFDTGGVNSEINLLTDKSLARLAWVRSLLYQHYWANEVAPLPQLHLFGVSTPNVVSRFPLFGATSFDSSGWMRTAGLGNVYLPFQGRRNVSHRSSSFMSGRGLTASEFYTQCERSHHDCPFCRNYERLQGDRFVRMLHNAVVFSEMTEQVCRQTAVATGPSGSTLYTLPRASSFTVTAT
jgi:ribosomal protein S18 acetylase RimI-like enzyme